MIFIKGFLPGAFIITGNLEFLTETGSEGRINTVSGGRKQKKPDVT
jgi:hypothetical protein